MQIDRAVTHGDSYDCVVQQEQRNGRIAYLLLVHTQPDQLARLLSRLLEGNEDRAIIHVDAVVDQAPFEARTAAWGDRVEYLSARWNIKWGGFDMCRATLELLRVACGQDADHHVLASGVDYPIRPVEELREELASGAVYMDSRPMPVLEWHRPMTRLSRFTFVAKNRSNKLARLVFHLLQVFPPRNVRRGLGGRQPYAGAQWWAFPAHVSRAVLDFADREPRLVRFFSRSTLPDEMFFQTVVAAACPGEEVRLSFTYADWGGPPPRPATLTAADLPKLQAAARRGHYLARKFDWRQHRALYDLVDSELLDVADGVASALDQHPGAASA